jgi:hypothetical protein
LRVVPAVDLEVILEELAVILLHLHSLTLRATAATGVLGASMQIMAMVAVVVALAVQQLLVIQLATVEMEIILLTKMAVMALEVAPAVDNMSQIMAQLLLL